MNAQTNISAEQFQQACNQGDPHILDVRTPLEFREAHATGSLNIPLDRLDPTEAAKICRHDEGHSIYLLCRSGNRARQALKKFQDKGIANVVVVDGGIAACEQSGMRLTRGKKAMSLERQVRIAAGSLTFTGTALAFFVSEWFLILPAFVGAGLAFAGITDTCGMGMLLARMPWNQISHPESDRGKEAPQDNECAIPQ